MVTTTAKIKIGDNIKVLSAEINIPNEDFSATINEVVNQKTTGENEFILGSTPLGTAVTADRSNAYIGTVYQTQGTFTVGQVYTISIKFSDRGKTVLCIVFDEWNGGYPKTITVGDKVYKNNSTKFFHYCEILSSDKTINVSFSDWSKENTPIKIQGIYNLSSIEIDGKNSNSLNSKTDKKSDISQPSWGLISNNSSLTFIDYNNIVPYLNEKGLLVEGLAVEIFLSNTLYPYQKEQIGGYLTNTWSYNSTTKLCTVTYTDDLEDWQSIDCAELEIQDGYMNMLNFYNHLKRITPTKWLFKELDSKTQEWLSNIYFYLPSYSNNNLWALWDGFCKANALYLYSENNYVIVSHDF
jgi:hypothetical protein